MNTSSSVRVMSPEEIVARGGDTSPRLVFPDRSSLFSERSLRLRQLAAGHAMREFLIFMADLAQAQHHALTRAPTMPLPDAAAVERSGDAGQPPLEANTWSRDPAWRALLAQIIAELRPRAPQAAQATLDALAERMTHDVDELERQADRLLNGVTLGLDLEPRSAIAEVGPAARHVVGVDVDDVGGLLWHAPQPLPRTFFDVDAWMPGMAMSLWASQCEELVLDGHVACCLVSGP